MNIPSRDEMHELEASSRLFSEDGTIYLSCWLLSFESPIPINSSVAFVVTQKQFVSIRYSDHHAFRIFKNAGSRLQSRRFKHSNDALVELIEAVVGQVASTLRLVEQDLNSLSLEIFAEPHTQQRQVKKLGLKRMVQRLGKQNSLIACLRESSVSLAALTSYFLEHGKGQLQPGATARLKTVEQDIGSLRQYDAELSSEVGFLLDATVGVTAALSRRSNAIHIRCQPGVFSIWALLEVIESALAHALPLSKRPKARMELRPALIRANLALAPIADYIFPPLGLANAVLIVGLSGNHLGPAARRLAQGKAGLDLLYCCIALCTLTTFTFLPSALMYWLLAFWPQLTKKIRQEGELNFLARLRRRPRRVLVERTGEEAELKVHELKPGDVVILKAGDNAPADGVVVTGEAKIQETCSLVLLSQPGKPRAARFTPRLKSRRAGFIFASAPISREPIALSPIDNARSTAPFGRVDLVAQPDVKTPG